jgi:lipopolysaccharide/colanic/teichoic acid biosynthesis glycosyltransferase
MVLAPLLAAVWMAIRLSSRGPAIYRQERVGQGGRMFTLYKFRSMRIDAGGSKVTVPGDPRVTRLGRILRKTSLDELPQLVNVLRGDMTLVGTRPETPELAARYDEMCARVFQYRPGMTGPGQLRYRDEDALPHDGQDVDRFYFEVLLPRRTSVDLEYLENPTMSRTIGLLAETAGQVVAALLGRKRPQAGVADATATDPAGEQRAEA